MAEPLEPEINEYLTFEDGLEAGQETIDDVAERLIGEGFDEDEVEELLYDPAPRRRRHHRAHRAKSYDPAPRRGRRRGRSAYPGGRRKRYVKRAKGMLSKLRPYVMPAAAGLTFYAAYQQRATATGTSIVDLIMADIKNFDGQAAMTRLQDKAAPVLGATIGGYLVKKFAPGKLKLIGDVLIGVGVGTAGKAILDPPGLPPGVHQRSVNVVSVGMGPGQTQGPQPVGMVSNNPYGRLGGS